MAKTSTKPRAKELDGLEILMADHARVEKLFQQYEKLPADRIGDQRDLLRKIVRELSIHANIEEEILYPMVRESVPGGDALVEEGLEEHAQVEELLAAIEKTSLDEGLDADVNGVIEDVRHHVREEEEELFPKIRAHVSEERLLDMGRGLEIAKRTAPTRPHPRTPDTPPANIALGLPMAAVDRARDLAVQVVKTGYGVGRGVVNMGVGILRSLVSRR